MTVTVDVALLDEPTPIPVIAGLAAAGTTLDTLLHPQLLHFLHEKLSEFASARLAFASKRRYVSVVSRSLHEFLTL